jgi:two-component system NtrC family response regulator
MPLNLREVREEAERKAVLRALSLTQGNVSKASELLGITRPTCYDLMQKYDLGKSPAPGKV